MNYDNATLANVFSIATIVLGASTLGLLFLWIRTREELLQARRELQLGAQPDARLQAIEQTLDELSVQVERVGEVDRFAARLLAERLPLPASTPPLHRQVTPH